MTNHEHGCCCGHDHAHHEHAHGEACACGCEHTHFHGELTAEEERVLDALEHFHYLPIVRFTLTSSKEDELYSVAMEPVYLVSEDESMEDARKDSAPFASLEEKGLITLDYDLPLQQYDYSLYENSALYAYFKASVAESAGRPGFLFDTPNLEKGSVALA